jgi:hypothetical protein
LHSILLEVVNHVGQHGTACHESCSKGSGIGGIIKVVIPCASPKLGEHSEFRVTTANLLENPLTFFTNTRHLLQCYHLSFSTKKDCIFSRNTVVNIDVAPRLPVCHIITESE